MQSDGDYRVIMTTTNILIGYREDARDMVMCETLTGGFDTMSVLALHELCQDATFVQLAAVWRPFARRHLFYRSKYIKCMQALNALAQLEQEGFGDVLHRSGLEMAATTTLGLCDRTFELLHILQMALSRREETVASGLMFIYCAPIKYVHTCCDPMGTRFLRR